ncbi:MAG TPA: M48 family metallopeptidase [Spirochaetota bacterium]|nr:M48 family metallopeptidase [Spirochaetota bacterium]HOM39122.1 M48 family metallopeptidase [Spirochaetota bacterium]HPQ50005.1 M48 family metallopeptidase [Spirochaetota bacterium]
MRIVLSDFGLDSIKVIVRKKNKKKVTLIPTPNNFLIIETPNPKNIEEYIVNNINKIKDIFEKYDNHYFNVRNNIKKDLILLKGNYVPFFTEKSSSNRSYLKNGRLIIKYNGKKKLESLLKDFLRKIARKEFLDIVEEESKRLSISVGSVKIKDARSRWGSCSSKGNINLSFRLIMAPEYVYRYVIIHELSHIKFPNHSENFWNYLKDVYPDYEKGRLWLKENGAYLYTL